MNPGAAEFRKAADFYRAADKASGAERALLLRLAADATHRADLQGASIPDAVVLDEKTDAGVAVAKVVETSIGTRDGKAYLVIVAVVAVFAYGIVAALLGW